MAEITKIITQSDTQHILCLKPNQENIPNQVQGHFLLQQLRSKSVLDISVLRRESFEIDITISDFAMCYCCLVDGLCGELKGRKKGARNLKMIGSANDGYDNKINDYCNNNINNNNNNNNNYDTDNNNNINNSNDTNHYSATVHRSLKAACTLILQHLTDTSIIPRKLWKISDFKVFLYRQEHVRCIDRLLQKKIVSTASKIQRRWRKYRSVRRRIEELRERAVAMRREMEEEETRREEEERRKERRREMIERRKEECSAQVQRVFRGYDVRKVHRVGWDEACVCVFICRDVRR
jgi:myosin heavy subunit